MLFLYFVALETPENKPLPQEVEMKVRKCSTEYTVHVYKSEIASLLPL